MLIAVWIIDGTHLPPSIHFNANMSPIYQPTPITPDVDVEELIGSIYIMVTCVDGSIKRAYPIRDGITYTIEDMNIQQMRTEVVQWYMNNCERIGNAFRFTDRYGRATSINFYSVTNITLSLSGREIVIIDSVTQRDWLTNFFLIIDLISMVIKKPKKMQLTGKLCILS